MKKYQDLVNDRQPKKISFNNSQLRKKLMTVKPIVNVRPFIVIIFTCIYICVHCVYYIPLFFVFIFPAYLICWAPVTIAAILTHHDIIVKPGLWYQILYLLAPLNSLANPLVFLIFNTKMFLSKTHKTKTRVVSGTALKIT